MQLLKEKMSHDLECKKCGKEKIGFVEVMSLGSEPWYTLFWECIQKSEHLFKSLVILNVLSSTSAERLCKIIEEQDLYITSGKTFKFVYNSIHNPGDSQVLQLKNIIFDWTEAQSIIFFMRELYKCGSFVCTALIPSPSGKFQMHPSSKLWQCMQKSESLRKSLFILEVLTSPCANQFCNIINDHEKKKEIRITSDYVFEFVHKWIHEPYDKQVLLVKEKIKIPRFSEFHDPLFSGSFRKSNVLLENIIRTDVERLDSFMHEMYECGGFMCTKFRP